ncbi:unnamed protein product, partial [marine sediment metagenome]
DNFGLIKNKTLYFGHSADFIAGKHFNIYQQNTIKNLDEAALEIINGHYKGLKIIKNIKIKKEIFRRILKQIKSYKTKNIASIIDRWNLENRQRKNIINSMRIIEALNSKFRLPLYDYHFLDFFSELPIEYKFNQYLYIKNLRENWLKDSNLLEIQAPEKAKLDQKTYLFRLINVKIKKLIFPIFVVDLLYPKNKKQKYLNKLHYEYNLKSISHILDQKKWKNHGKQT